MKNSKFNSYFYPVRLTGQKQKSSLEDQGKIILENLDATK